MLLLPAGFLDNLFSQNTVKVFVILLIPFLLHFESSTCPSSVLNTPACLFLPVLPFAFKVLESRAFFVVFQQKRIKFVYFCPEEVQMRRKNESHMLLQLFDPLPLSLQKRKFVLGSKTLVVFSAYRGSTGTVAVGFLEEEERDEEEYKGITKTNLF